MKKYLFLLFLGVFLISNASAVISRNLSVGVYGSDVAELQSELGVQSTGYFGNLTRQAVKAWQIKNELPATGYFGSLSKRVWNSSVDEDAYPVRLPPIPVGSSVDPVRLPPTPVGSNVDPVRLPPIPEDFCTYVKGTVIRVLSPNGGEVYQAGQQVTVKWKTCNIPSDANIKLVLGYNGAGGGSAGDMWLSNLSGSQNFVNDGSETIIIPDNFSWASSPIPSGKYYSLSAEYNTSSMNIRDGSDGNFTINGQATTVCDSTVTPSIKVLSPNGGETYQTGQEVTVKWTSCNIPATDQIYINFGTSNSEQRNIVTVPNTGSAIINLPSAQTLINWHWPAPGSYTIGLQHLNKNNATDVYTVSNIFTITNPTTALDSTPRVAMWYGKVNQHTNSNGQWMTDPDGVSGAGTYSQWGSEGYGDRKLEYCKKFYPNTTSVSDYKNENITTWRERGNTGGPHTASFMTTKCIQGAVTGNTSITVLSPNGGEVFTDEQQITVKWTSSNIPADSQVNLVLVGYNANGNMTMYTLLSQEKTLNDGSEVVKLHKIPTYAGVGFGKYFKIEITDNGNGHSDSSNDLFTINGATTAVVDTIPRIGYWWGKVNQHVDTNGNWLTDPDGTSGASLDKLTYCKKWYPNTTSVADYKTESINSWRNAGNTGGPYTASFMTTKCIQGSAELNQYIKLLSPKVSDTFTAGQNVNISWSTNASQNTYVYLSIFDSNMNFVREFRTPNDYQETIKIPLATPAGKYRIYYQVVAGPNDSGYNMSDFISVNVVSPNITTNDTTPRIAYWWGKVNQHFEQIDVRGEWMTDGDGVSGANLDKLTYCKKFYPNTISIADYKNETITGWRNAGNTGGPYTLEVMTTKCVFR